jgi:hypothetical protein
MKYELNKDEEKFILEKVTPLLEGKVENVDFTGTKISPYMLREYFLNKGFTDDYESNSDDNWIYLSKGEKQYTISSNSMSFELLIYREDD